MRHGRALRPDVPAGRAVRPSAAICQARAASLPQAPVPGNDQALVEQRIGRLDDSGYRFISPTDPGQRAAIVVISGADPGDNEAVCQRPADAGIDAALRAGNVRLSPHLYNSPGQIQHAAAILASATATSGTGKRRA